MKARHLWNAQKEITFAPVKLRNEIRKKYIRNYW